MRQRQREHFSLPWSLAKSQMKGFGYDGAALSSPHQSLTPKFAVCLAQGGLRSLCSLAIRDCLCLTCCCVLVQRAFMQHLQVVNRQCEKKLYLWLHMCSAGLCPRLFMLVNSLTVISVGTLCPLQVYNIASMSKASI